MTTKVDELREKLLRDFAPDPNARRVACELIEAARAEGIAQGRAERQKEVVEVAWRLMEKQWRDESIELLSKFIGLIAPPIATPTPSEPTWEDGKATEVATIAYGADGVNSVSMGDKTISMPGGTPFIQLTKSEPVKEKLSWPVGYNREDCQCYQKVNDKCPLHGEPAKDAVVLNDGTRIAIGGEPLQGRWPVPEQPYLEPAKVCATCGGKGFVPRILPRDIGCKFPVPVDCPDCAGGSQ
jgi:hypothetical protein